MSGLAYFVDPDSVERAITQLAQLHGITDVALTAACLWFFLRDNQALVSEVIGSSIQRVD